MGERRKHSRGAGFDPAFGEPALAFLKLANVFILVGSTVFAIAIFALVPEQILRILGPAGASVVAAITWFLLSRGRIAAAVHTLAFGFWAVVTVIAFFTGGVSGMAIIAYPAIILLLGWMIGTRSAAVMALLSAASTLGFAVAESWGFLPGPPPTPPAMRWMVQSLIFVFTVVLIVYFVRSYQSRLNQAIELDRDLNRAQAVAHVGSWVYELATDTLRLSAETCRIFGLPKGVTGNHRSYLGRVHPEDRARVDAAWQEALKGGAPFDNEHRILIGETVRWVRQIAELELGEDGAQLRSVGTTQDVTERKMAEEAITASEARFRDLLQDIPNVAVQGYGMDGTTQYWNRASERLYGYTQDEAVGRNLLDLIIPPEMREGVSAAITQMAVTRTAIPAAKLSLMRKDGSRVAVYSSHALVQPPGRELELFCIDIDLSERHQAEAALRESEERFRILFEGAPDAIVLADPVSRRIVDANKAASRLLGRAHEAIVGMHQKDLHPPQTEDRSEATFSRHVEESRVLGYTHPIENIALRPNGTQVPIEVLAQMIRLNNQDVLMGTFRDISERKRNEDEFRTIIQASIDGFWTTDFSGRILDVNDSICRILGYTRIELLGMNIRQIDADETADEVAAHTQAIIRAGNARFLARHRRKDGRVVDVEVSVLHVAALGERLFAFVRDISAQKHAEAARAEVEAQLRESQKMEALGTLAGGVAHDFNNIVAAINGNVELARQDVGEAHAAMESLEEIRKAGQRAKDLVQQILAFGRRQVLERRAISLEPVVRETARLLRATLPAGIALNVDCAPDAPQVLADATQIEQVLLNLCSNAWQAMRAISRPGSIDIRLTRHIVDGAPYCGPERRSKGERIELRPGHYTCLTVSDNGSGMDESVRAHIFEPFFTTKQVGEGTGLGLAVVHGILHKHDASIVAQSAPGEGATFRTYFSAVEQSGAADARRGLDATVSQALVLEGEGRQILYVDDDEAIVFLMKRLLERRGYRVSGHTDAHSAIAAVHARPGEFDLVVSDYNMPGMSGLDVAQAIKLIRADLPVAIASGYITEELRTNASGAGVSELIYKPDTTEEFCETVARLINTLPA